MDALQSNIGPLVLGHRFDLRLSLFSTTNQEPFTIRQFTAALETTTTLTAFSVYFDDYEATPENNRRVIQPLCRCMANLRRHNPNHPLRTLDIKNAKESHSDSLDLFLVTAKQCEIHNLSFFKSHLRIQSLVEYCCDNSHIQQLNFVCGTRFSDKFSTDSPQDGTKDSSSAVLALDLLALEWVSFENSLAASKFLSFTAHVTYTKMLLGKISVGGDGDDENLNEKEEHKMTRRRIVSELIKPSVEELILMYGCQIEVMNVIEACATVKEIQLVQFSPPIGFRAEESDDKVWAIAARNWKLARFVDNPLAYPRDELLALMCQFDSSPTGRYMLACAFAGMPGFFKI